jgi:hypothetical protein
MKIETILILVILSSITSAETTVINEGFAASINS